MRKKVPYCSEPSRLERFTHVVDARGCAWYGVCCRCGRLARWFRKDVGQDLVRIELAKSVHKLLRQYSSQVLRGAHIVMHEVLDAPPVLGRQLHDLSFQLAFSRVTRDWFAATAGSRLVVGADPRGQALIGHLSRDIAEHGRNELVVQMKFVPGSVGEYGICPFRELSLAEAAWQIC